jgi:predicted DNA-binding transcriptional regulator YafY
LQQIQRTEIPFQLEHGTLDDFRKKENDSPKTKVRILVDKSIVKFIQSDLKNYGFVAEEIKGDQVEMTFLTHSVEHGFARWYLMFGDYAQILEPQSLRDSLLQIVEKTKNNLL